MKNREVRNRLKKSPFHIILSILIFAFPYDGNAQENLDQLLQGKTTLRQIMPVVDDFFRKQPKQENKEEFESEYLHWKRWEWYVSGRLGPQGEFVNSTALLFEGLKAKDRMHVGEDRNINSNWSFIGPSSSPLGNNSALYNGLGRVDRVYFHPTNPSIVYIATPAGGLWNTLNDGITWNNLTDHLPSLGISGFVISWANTSDMYLLTGDGDSDAGGLVETFGYMRPSIGVLKSTDGGVSWHQTGVLPQGPSLYTGYQLVQSPTDPLILFAATSKGLYRTTDGGTTWTRELSLLTYDVDFKPGDGTRAYASVFGDFWISTNSGASWTSNSTYNFDPGQCLAQDGVTYGGRIQIGVSPASPNRVYLLSGPVTAAGVFCGVWLSTDSGASFIRQSNTPNILGESDAGNDPTGQTRYDLCIAVRPTSGSNVITGGLTVWRSTTSGGTWIHATSYNEDSLYAYIHPDVHDLSFNPINNALYAATDGGLFKSTDYGSTWSDLSPNIETSQFYHLAGWDGNQYKYLGGLQDNGIKYRKTNNSEFNHIIGGDGFDIVFNPNTGQPAYGTGNDVFYIFSNDGQNSSAYYVNEDFFFQPLAVHNTKPDTVLVGSNDIYKSTTGSVPFSNKGATGSWAMTSCPSNSNRFYSAGDYDYGPDDNGRLYFSADIGETWTLKSTNTGFPAANTWTKITDLAVNPTLSSVIWASFGGFNAGVKVVMSSNTGDSWTNMSANLPNVPINCLAIDNNGGAYAGTDIGVFYRGPSMSNWMPWSNKLPNVPVTDLVIFDDGTTKKLRASTFGRGVWQSDLAGTCDAAVVVTGNLEGIQHYEASTSISSSGFIQGGAGTFVSFKSGNYINLTTGFNVVDDSEFLGFINPCGVGGIPSAQDNTPINREDPNSSIILLRRMWDPLDGLPYGSIEILAQNSRQAQVVMNIKNPGSVQIVAARMIQDKLATLYDGHEKPGNHTLDLDLSHLPPEFHYLLLFYEGKLIHFQELDLTSN